jgi:flagellar biosynthesis/type III secretory pathway protein FliH
MANQESLAKLEVNTMSQAAVAQIFEELGYNRKWKEQGIQQGIQQGIAIGEAQGLQQGIRQGVQEGIQQGVQEGIQQGIQQGVQQGIQQGVRQGVQQGIHSTLRALQGLKNHEALEGLATETGLPLEEIKKIQAEFFGSALL